MTFINMIIRHFINYYVNAQKEEIFLLLEEKMSLKSATFEVFVSHSPYISFFI